MTKLSWLVACLGVASVAPVEAASGAPPELGAVRWHRDLAAAQKLAESSGRPLLILFDEVPGCQTCVRYGQAVLRTPLLVEAAETEFVPLAIYNNEGGADRAALRRFEEPTWNNPVVRIVDAKLADLAPRLAGDYSKRGLALTMQTALQAAGRPVPTYLATFAAELAPTRPETAHYAMYCFWSGEVCLGALPGVVSTRAGFSGGHEVVEVRYDPAVTSLAALNAAAAACGKPVDGARFRFSAKDDKYHLRRSPLRSLSLTDLQRTRLNAALGRSADPRPLLSPRQRAALPRGGRASRRAKPSVP